MKTAISQFLAAHESYEPIVGGDDDSMEVDQVAGGKSTARARRARKAKVTARATTRARTSRARAAARATPRASPRARTAISSAIVATAASGGAS
eukprot:987048-Alexandrium_andersonii.AAC.1